MKQLRPRMALSDRPLFLFVAGGAVLLAGMAILGPATFWSRAHGAGGRWELAALVLLAALAALAGGLQRLLQKKNMQFAGRLTAAAEERPWLLPLAVGLAWTVGWSVTFALRDPGWVPSGIDWHDSYFGAYAYLHDDPIFYHPARYPLYPAMAALITEATGLQLTVSLQLLSRAATILVAIPIYVIGRDLFGRGPAVGALVLLPMLATFQMNADAVTPYPFMMLFTMTALAALVTGVRGRPLSSVALGLSLGAMLANDGKGILVALGLGGLGLLVAVCGPRGAGSRLPLPFLAPLRVALLVLPILASYAWMSRQPEPFTLEQLSANYLVEDGILSAESQAELADGFAWGHMSGPGALPRTLQTFMEASRDPAMAERNLHQRFSSMERLGRDYPDITSRLPIALGLVLLLPLLGPQTWRNRAATLIRLAAVAVVLLSCLPALRSDYQDRYVLHAAVLLPLLLAALVDVVLRSTLAGSPAARGVALVGACAAFLFWPSNPLAIQTMGERMNPVALGGTQEVEIRNWARAEMAPEDILLDTSWLSAGLLLAGERTLARGQNTYPPPGVPWPGDAWRFTHPKPTLDGGGTSRDYYSLVNYLAPRPGSADAPHGPPDISGMDLQPDSELGRRTLGETAWQPVFKTSDGLVQVLRYTGQGSPPGWNLRPPRAMRAGPSSPPRHP